MEADPANGACDDPSVPTYCTDDELVVQSNGIPDFPFEPTTPNELETQDWEWRVTRSPELASSTTSIPDLLGAASATLDAVRFDATAYCTLHVLNAYDPARDLLQNLVDQQQVELTLL